MTGCSCREVLGGFLATLGRNRQQRWAALEGTPLPNTSHTYSGATQAPWQRAVEVEQESEHNPRPAGHISVLSDILVVPVMWHGYNCRSAASHSG